MSYLNMITYTMSAWLFARNMIKQVQNTYKQERYSESQRQTASYQAAEGTWLSPKLCLGLKRDFFFAVQISESRLPAQTVKDPF